MRTFNTGLAIVLTAAVLAGCQSSRFGDLDTRASARPAPLPAAPSGTVSSGQLPPPSSPSQFPDAPSTPTTGTDIAAVEPQVPPASSISTPPASAPDVSKNALVGSWKVASGGSSCQMFLTLTKFGSGSRGGTRGCSGDLANVRVWDVSGKQVVLKNETGETIGRLYGDASGSTFSGQTNDGQPVTLTR